MVKTYSLTNKKIYELAVLAVDNFHGDIKFPAKAMFYIQKNVNVLTDLGKELEAARTRILERYGKLIENENQQSYNIPKENLSEAQKETNDLFDAEQEVRFYMLKLDWLEGVELTPPQMSVLELMIDEES